MEIEDENIHLTLEEINSIITSLKCCEKNSLNLSCPICSKITSNITTHLLLKHTIQEYHNCNLCSAKFEDKLYLELHKINHLDDNRKQFQCNYCNLEFKEEILRKIHEIKIHKEDNYLHRCNICNRKFNISNSFFKHLLVHVEQLNPEYSKYFCNICEEFYFTLERLESHFSDIHPDKFVDETKCRNFNYIKSDFKENNINDEINIESENIFNHKLKPNKSEFENIILNSDNDNIEFQPNLIEEEIQSNLIEEILEISYSFNGNEEDNEEYIVEETEDKIIEENSNDSAQIFKNQNDEKIILVEEYLEDIDDMENEQFCPFNNSVKQGDKFLDPRYDSDDDLPVFEFFEDMKNENEPTLPLSTQLVEIEKLKLINKSRSKGSGRKFPCPVCSKLFRTRAIVNEHLNIHTGQRPHKCTVCSQEFSFKVALKRHAKAHNNEKNYTCTFCNESFITNFEKNRHEKIWHADDNKIKSYKEKKYLNPKALKNNEDNLYHCAFCNKKYERAQSLRQHLKLHTNSKVCTICKKAFGFLSSLKRHMSNVHTINFKSNTEKLIEIEILKT